MISVALAAAAARTLRVSPSAYHLLVDIDLIHALDEKRSAKAVLSFQCNYLNVFDTVVQSSSEGGDHLIRAQDLSPLSCL